MQEITIIRINQSQNLNNGYELDLKSFAKLKWFGHNNLTYYDCIQQRSSKEKLIRKESDQSISINVINPLLKLRGGGCGVSKEVVHHQDSKTKALSMNNLQTLPSNFFTELEKYLKIITIQTHVSSDLQQQEEMFIAIQWFNTMKEHFNNVCQNQKYSSSSFDLVFENLPLILKSAISLLRISGFLCYQVLLIGNDLARMLFSYFLTNKARFFKIEDKNKLENLIEEFETQLELESSNIWVAGAEFEIEMMKAVIQSSPSNSDEGKKLLVSFMGELVKSALSMSPSEGLIESLIQGAIFLHKAYQIRSLKEKYEIYYYFESLKWQILNSLKQNETSVQRILELINDAYKDNIEKSKDWFLHFCWVKFITDLIIYRPIIYKQQLDLEQQKQWSTLIQDKLIRQTSFDRRCGRILLCPNPHTERTYSISQVLLNYGKESFQLFQDSLLSTLQAQDNQIFNFNLNQSLVKEKYDYSLSTLLENNDLKQYIEEIGYIDKFHKIINSFKQYLKKLQFPILDSQQQQIDINNIQIGVREVINIMLSIEIYINKSDLTIKLHLERLQYIISSIKVEKKQEPISIFNQEQMANAAAIYTYYVDNCHKYCDSLQQQKSQFIQSMVNFSYRFLELLEPEHQNGLDELISQIFQLIDIFLRDLQSFKESILETVSRIIKFKTLYFHKYKKTKMNFQIVNPIMSAKQMIQSAINSNYIGQSLKQILLILENISASRELNILQKISQYCSLKYLIQDVMTQINTQNTIFQSIQDFFKINFLSKSKKVERSVGIEQQIKFSNQMLSEKVKKQFKMVSEYFFPTEQSLQNISPSKVVKPAEILLLIRKDWQQLQQITSNVLTRRTLYLIIMKMKIVEQRLGQYLEQPDKLKISKTKILALLEDNIQLLANSLSLEKSEEIEQMQQQNDPKVVRQIEQIQGAQSEQLNNKNIFQSEPKKDYQYCFTNELLALQETIVVVRDALKMVEENLELHQTVWETCLELKLNNQEKIISNLFTSTDELIECSFQQILKEFTLLKKETFTYEIQEDSLIFVTEIVPEESLNDILLHFFDIALQLQLIPTIEKQDKSLFGNGRSMISDAIQRSKDMMEDYHYKVRQCFVMNLLLIEAAQLEPSVVAFCQKNMVYIWTREKDERVKQLLKNSEILEMQKKLFSHDLQTFSNKLQQEMKARFDSMNDLEQKIKLEGNAEKREQFQQYLEQQHLELEEYLDNINDMTGKLDINIAFLKEIKKDLTKIKQKIDHLSDVVNDIGDGIRKLRGKTFKELLNIRKKKILEQQQLRDINSIYIPWNVQEWDTTSEQPLQGESLLLVENIADTKGKMNEFLEQKQKDVMLLRGYAGSGKSRAATKIEEFLWQKLDQNQSPWVPLYVSLPSLKEPKYNLIDQALESEYYEFDKIQIRELKEAIATKQLKVILILDSYDEMKQENIEQNLFKTNRLTENLFGENSSNNNSSSQQFKVVITTRSEILISSSYLTWFYGESIESLKEIEIKGFDQGQQKEYLQQYTILSVKKELYELYEFIKSATKEKIDLNEFTKIWKNIQSQLVSNQTPYAEQEYILSEDESVFIIALLKLESSFRNISNDQAQNLHKRLITLWSKNRFEVIIQKANIQSILTTPFLMEIVVQVLPGMIQKYSDIAMIKKSFIRNFIQIYQETLQEKYLIAKYQNNNKQTLEENADHEQNINYESLAHDKWDQLESAKVFKKYSIIEQINKNNLQDIEDSEIVIQALRIKTFTLLDFYACFTDFYHKRQISKLKECGRAINFDTFLIDLTNFSQSLALDLTIYQLTQVKYDAKCQLKLHHFQNFQYAQEDWKDEYFNDFDGNGEYKKLIRSCSLLTLKGSTNSFTHKSIQEYYVASYLLNIFDHANVNMQDPNRVSLQQFIKGQLYNTHIFNIQKEHFRGALSLMKESMKQSKDLTSKLIEIVQLSRMSEFVRAASNSIYLLGLNRDFLGNQEFRNIQISDTNLQGLSFFHSNLEGSIFSNVNISSCNFSNANLKSVQWNPIGCNEQPQLNGHLQKINSVAFSPNGFHLASGSEDTTIRLWDIKQGKEIALICGHTGEVCSVIFSADGSMLASGSADKTVRLWNTQQKNLRLIFEGHTKSVVSVIFSSDNQTLVSGSYDKTIRFWDIKTEKLNAILEGHSDYVNQIAFSPDCKMLASCSDDQRIGLWNSKTKQKITFLEGHTTDIFSVAFSPDGQILASASGCGSSAIFLWDVKERKRFAILDGQHRDYLTQVVFSPDGECLASSSADNTIRLWDVEAKKQIIRLEGHTNRVYSVAFSPNSKILASGSSDLKIQLWDIQAGKQLILLDGHSDKVNAVVFSPDSQILASCSSDETIRLWNFKTGKQLAVLRGHTNNIFSLAFSPDGQILASGGGDRTIRLWNVKARLQFDLILDHCYFVAFSPDGNILASGGAQQMIRLWDIKLKKEIILLQGHSGSIQGIKFSFDSKILVTNSSDRIIILWDVSERKQLLKLKGHSDVVCETAFSPDGQRLASGSSDKTIRIWNTKDGKQLTLMEDNCNICSVAFSPDGELLAAGRVDGNVRFWSATTGKQLTLLEGHTTDINSVSFSPDGSTFASGSNDKTIRLWKIDKDIIKYFVQSGNENSAPQKQDDIAREVQRKLGQISQNIQCYIIIGQIPPLLTNNSIINGAKIVTSAEWNLVPFFIQRGAIYETNI